MPTKHVPLSWLIPLCILLFASACGEDAPAGDDNRDTGNLLDTATDGTALEDGLTTDGEDDSREADQGDDDTGGADTNGDDDTGDDDTGDDDTGDDDTGDDDTGDDDARDCANPDQDDDGHDAVVCGGDDCDDSRSDVHPEASELCDGVSNTCGEIVDNGLSSPGVVCEDDGDCCSDFCFEGLCLGEPGACLGADSSCTTAAECCSSRCEPISETESACVGDTVCQQAGQTCTQAADCCSTACIGGFCRADATCLQVDDECDLDSDCCTDSCNGENVCEVPAGGCGSVGESCENGGDCCSEACLDNVCPSTGGCRPQNDVCDDDSDCCVGACSEGGRCVELTACPTFGEPCQGGGECCSNACEAIATGVTVCQFVGGCRPIDEVCTDDSQCCSDICDFKSGDPDDEVRRCRDPGGGCVLAGELCGFAAPNNCCDPESDDHGQEFCILFTEELSRCTDSVGLCQPDGSSCSVSDNCCSLLCLPDDDGNLLCGGQDCAVEDGLCFNDDDCCDAETGCNSVNRCAVEPTPDCTPDGGGCAEPAECCSETCIGDGDQTCGGVECAAEGSNCLIADDCCDAETGCNVRFLCGDDDVVCSPVGGDCEDPEDCCLGSCTDGICDGELGCSVTGDVCGETVDCCEGPCLLPPEGDEGLCFGRCLDDGESCTRSDDCCDGICGADATCEPPLVECITLGGACEPGGAPCCRLTSCEGSEAEGYFCTK